MKKALFLALILQMSCGKKGAQTPEAALDIAQQAYLKKDVKAFLNILSKETIIYLEEKIEPYRTAFQTAPDNPQAQQAFEAMAQSMGMPVSKLKDLTIEDFVSYMLKNEEGAGTETTIFPQELLPPAKVLRRVEKGNKATLYFEEGQKLIFLKTDTGWKMHLDTDGLEITPAQKTE